MTTHGGTARIEIETLRSRIDELLEKLIDVINERDLAQERCAYAEHQLQTCQESV